MMLINLIRLLIENSAHGGWIHYEDLAYDLEQMWDWGRWNAETSHKRRAWWDAKGVIAEFNDDIPF